MTKHLYFFLFQTGPLQTSGYLRYCEDEMEAQNVYEVLQATLAKGQQFIRARQCTDGYMLADSFLPATREVHRDKNL